VPLVRTERPVYRARAPQRSAEREVVVLICDFRNRAELAKEHLPQDMLYVLTLYVDALGKALRNAHGVLSYVEPDSICALFGLDRPLSQAARQALQAAAAIARVLVDLNDRLGRQWDCKVDVAVSIDAGRAVVGEVGVADPPAMMAMGEAMEVAGELRKAITGDSRFAISERVYAAAELPLPDEGRIKVSAQDMSVAATLTPAPPPLPASWTPLGPGAALQRMWGG
jgi:adenylate cyclase